MKDRERLHQENLARARIYEEESFQRGRAILSLFGSMMAVNSRTTGDWQRFEERFVVDIDRTEVFPGVKALWEAIRNSSEAVLCLSRLVGLARDGISYYELAEELRLSKELGQLLLRWAERR